MAVTDSLNRVWQSKIFWMSLVCAGYIALAIHQWIRHLDRIGLWLALICTAISAIILRDEIAKGIRNSRRKIADQSEGT